MLFFKSKLLCMLLFVFILSSCETPNDIIIADKPAMEEHKKDAAKNSQTDKNEANGQKSTTITPLTQISNKAVVSKEIKNTLQIPTLNLDVEARLIPGDKIRVELIDEEDMVKEFTISNSGVISYPYAKRVKITGKTVSEAEKAITDKLKKYYVDPVINISVVEWAERRVYLYGIESGDNSVVLNPTKGMTATQLLVSAGVSSKEIDLSRISLTRNIDGEQKVIAIPLQELLDNYDVKKDIILRPNDLIKVKEAPKVHVQGNVKSPGSFPIQQDEKINLWYALSLAEGPTEQADLENIKILREEQQGFKTIIASASDIKQSQVVILEADDIVVVPSQNEKVVTVHGQVRRPGSVKLVGRSVRLSTVIANAGGLTEYASSSIRVFRYFDDGKTQKFSLNYNAITSGDSRQDIEMLPGDIVYCDYGLW